MVMSFMRSSRECMMRVLIEMLDTEESVNELARILGGVEITDSVRESAAEMKQMAEQVKSGLRA